MLSEKDWNKIVSQLVKVIVLLAVLVILIPLVMTGIIYPGFKNPDDFKPRGFVVPAANGETQNIESSAPAPAEVDYFDRDFDVNQLGDDLNSEMIKYGYALIAETYKYIGPENGNPRMIYAGNNLSCKNCHLDAGTKKFAAPYIGVTGRFPQYRGREDVIGSIEERINGCMERSMNGKKLPTDSKEMRAMVSYMSWLGKDVPGGHKVKGAGFTKITIPDRAVDLENGKKVYDAQCIACHGENGAGVKNTDGLGYTYPPLWGDDTYNHGAGMNRVLTAAAFIKGNMPFGATADNPMISDEDAYDVAGYIDSKQRPLKANTDVDYPDLKRKPVSTPYGPWDDDFSAEQHKFGPFPPIIAFYKEKYGIEKNK